MTSNQLADSLEPDFTLDELLAELNINDETTLEGFHSSAEWSKRLKVNRIKTLAILNVALTKGKLLRSSQYRDAVDGTRRRVPVYALHLDRKGD